MHRREHSPWSLCYWQRSSEPVDCVFLSIFVLLVDCFYRMLFSYLFYFYVDILCSRTYLILSIKVVMYDAGGIKWGQSRGEDEACRKNPRTSRLGSCPPYCIFTSSVLPSIGSRRTHNEYETEETEIKLQRRRGQADERSLDIKNRRGYWGIGAHSRERKR